jgi:hypothetical protein
MLYWLTTPGLLLHQELVTTGARRMTIYVWFPGLYIAIIAFGLRLGASRNHPTRLERVGSILLGLGILCGCSYAALGYFGYPAQMSSFASNTPLLGWVLGVLFCVLCLGSAIVMFRETLVARSRQRQLPQQERPHDA